MPPFVLLSLFAPSFKKLHRSGELSLHQYNWMFTISIENCIFLPKKREIECKSNKFATNNKLGHCQVYFFRGVVLNIDLLRTPIPRSQESNLACLPNLRWKTNAAPVQDSTCRAVCLMLVSVFQTMIILTFLKSHRSILIRALCLLAIIVQVLWIRKTYLTPSFRQI